MDVAGPDLLYISLTERLAAAGCVAPEEEAEELLAVATPTGPAAAATGPGRGGRVDPGLLARLVARRVAGEPLAWVTGGVDFAGTRIRVDAGVYVPRAQSEIVVEAALEVLGEKGRAVDLCTGSGAVAAALQRARPGATVIGVDIDPAACRCARHNGVTVYEGSLDLAVPKALTGRVDVVTAVAPYVPTAQMDFLPRDARDYEPRQALDGGRDGLDVVRGVVAAAARLLRADGNLVVELGADQQESIGTHLSAHGFVTPPLVFRDEDGDLRAVRARWGG